jgi:hypothetical protein
MRSTIFLQAGQILRGVAQPTQRNHILCSLSQVGHRQVIKILCSSGPKSTVNHLIEKWFSDKIHWAVKQSPHRSRMFACQQGSIDGGANMG